MIKGDFFNKRRMIASIILFFLIFTFLLFLTSLKTNIQLNPESSHTITLSSTFTKQVASNIIKLDFNIQTEDITSNNSLNKNNLISNLIIQKLENLNLNKSQIQTKSFRIYPIYTYNKTSENSRITGFRTSNILEITVYNFSKIGKIIRIGTENNETTISNLNYGLSNSLKEISKNKALLGAISQVKNKSRIFEKSLDFKIKDIKSISENAYISNPSLIYYPRLQVTNLNLNDRTIQIMPKNIKVDAQVTIVYYIEN